MKNKKLWMILSLLCILSGMFLAVVGILLGGIPGFYLDKTGIHTSRENAVRTMEVFQDTLELEAFDCIDLSASYTDVMLVPSDRYAIDYRTTGTGNAPVCQVQNGRLTIREDPMYSDPRIWFFYASPGSQYIREPEPGPYYIKIEFPADITFSGITARIEYGDLELPDLQADTLQIHNEYGDVTFNGYSGRELELHMSAGALSFDAVNAEKCEIVNDYGDITLKEYTGQTLALRMSSGDLSLGTVQAGQTEIKNEYGSILIDQASGEAFTADLSSGSFLADRLDFTDITIENEYGTVQLGLPADTASCGYRLSTEYGYIRMDGVTCGEQKDEDGARYILEGNHDKMVAVSCESGDIVINTF